MLFCIFAVGYSASLTFYGSCEVMMEEDTPDGKNEKEVFFTQTTDKKELINFDEIAGIGFMGIAAAFIWGIVFDLISRLSNAGGIFGSIGVFLRQVCFACTAAIPVIAYAISIPKLEATQKNLEKHKTFETSNVCKTSNKEVQSLKRDELIWKSVKYGALTFGIGLLVSVSMLKFMQFYIGIAGCVPWGVYCLFTLLIGIVCIAYSGRFYYANLECSNRIVVSDTSDYAKKLKKDIGDSKGFDRLFKLKAPCELLKHMQQSCEKKKKAMKASCQTNTILVTLFISLSVVTTLALIMFILGVSYLSEVAWVCIP